MTLFFTICSNNYLAQAKILGNSLKIHCPDSLFIIVLVDEKSDQIEYNEIPYEVLLIRTIEPQLEDLIKRYSIIELNTCVKPRVFEYLLEERKQTKAVYLDPDIKLFNDLTELETALDANSILLTPHILTPIPLDGKWPLENQFHNYGIYNLGFIALRNTPDTIEFIKWWKERTYNFGYSRVDEGLFVDQLPINLVPLFFKGVHILTDMGYNMGPWNLHERYLTPLENGYLVNNLQKLKFFHFSAFKINSNELPIHYYNRFKMRDRRDLEAIYNNYNIELIEAGYSFYSQFKCDFINQRNKYLNASKRSNQKRQSVFTKVMTRLVKLIPSSFRLKLKHFFSESV